MHMHNNTRAARQKGGERSLADRLRAPTRAPPDRPLSAGGGRRGCRAGGGGCCVARHCGISLAGGGDVCHAGGGGGSGGQVAALERGARNSMITLSSEPLTRVSCARVAPAHSHCCTYNADKRVHEDGALIYGMYSRQPCTAGCHIAWYSASEEACVAECKLINKKALCDYAREDAPSTVTRLRSCSSSKNCGCPAGKTRRNYQPVANDGSDSACETGCRLASNLTNHAFYGRALTAAETASIRAARTTGFATLASSMASLKAHVTGTNVLEDPELFAARDAFVADSRQLKFNDTLLNLAFDLVDTFETAVRRCELHAPS